MDPRYLLLTPEDETGGRQRRFFSWLIWVVGSVVLFGGLLLSGMFLAAGFLLGVVLLVTVGFRILTRRVS